MTAPTWTTYGLEDGLPTDDVTALAVAPDGSVWIGTFQGGAAVFDGASWTTYAQEDGLAFHSSIEAVAVAPDGAAWFGTDNGLSRFDGQSWTTFTDADGPIGETILGITVASDGSMLFGTYAMAPVEGPLRAASTMVAPTDSREQPGPASRRSTAW
jgi:ligand-binding sensor domain-containing protein